VRFAVVLTRAYYRTISDTNTRVLRIIRVPTIRKITYDVTNELEPHERDRPFRQLILGWSKWEFYLRIWGQLGTGGKIK